MDRCPLTQPLGTPPKFQAVPGGRFKMPLIIRNTIFSKNSISWLETEFFQNTWFLNRGAEMTSFGNFGRAKWVILFLIRN